MWQSKHSPACWKRAHERRQGSSAVELPSRYDICDVKAQWLEWLDHNESATVSKCQVNVPKLLFCVMLKLHKVVLMVPSATLHRTACCGGRVKLMKERPQIYIIIYVHCCAQDVRSCHKELTTLSYLWYLCSVSCEITRILRVLYSLRPYIPWLASLYKPFWLLPTYFGSSTVKRALPCAWVHLD